MRLILDFPLLTVSVGKGASTPSVDCCRISLTSRSVVFVIVAVVVAVVAVVVVFVVVVVVVVFVVIIIVGQKD